MLAKRDLLVSKSTVENCFLKNNLNDMLFKYILVSSLKGETWVVMSRKESHEEWKKPQIQELERVCPCDLLQQNAAASASKNGIK